MNAIDNKDRVLMFAAGAGLVAGCLLWAYLRYMERSLQEGGELAAVLITSRYLPNGTIIRADLLQTVKVPKAYIQPGTLARYDVLESSPGQPRFRTAIPLLAGTQLLQSALVSLSTGQGLSQMIPEDRVAVSFGVDSVHGAGGNIRPGDLVDIVYTSKGDLMGRKATSTDTLFQATPVVAVGKNWKIQEAGTLEAGSKEIKEATEESADQTVLTVLLNPLAAVHLIQARENGTLSVVLRAPGNDRLWDNRP